MREALKKRVAEMESDEVDDLITTAKRDNSLAAIQEWPMNDVVKKGCDVYCGGMVNLGKKGCLYDSKTGWRCMDKKGCLYDKKTGWRCMDK